MKTVFSNRNLMAVTVAQSLSMFAMFLWRPFWGLYVLELGGSTSSLGALATLQSLSNLALQLPGGMLADRYGRRRVILVSSLFGFLPPLVFRLSSHWTMLIPGILASSLSALAMPARSALISESLPPEERATGFGAYTMAWYLLIVAAYPVGGYIMDTMGVVPGMRVGFVLSFLVMLPIMLVQWRFVSETLEPEQGAKPGESSRPWASVGELRNTPRRIWVLLVVAIMSCFGFQVFWSFVVVYCVETLGMTKMQWSVASIVANLVAACFMVPSGFLSDRARRKPIIILSQSLVATASMAYLLSTGFQGVVMARLLGGIGEGLGGNVFGSVGGPVWQALMTEAAPAELRGSVLGLVGTLTGFACTPAPWLGGYLYENISPGSPFLLSFLLSTLGVVLFAIFVKEPFSDEPASSEDAD